MVAAKKKTTKKSRPGQKRASKKKVTKNKNVPDDNSSDQIDVKPAESVNQSGEQSVDAEVVEPVNVHEKAAASRKALLNQLRSDLSSGIDAVLAAGDAAKADFRLIKTAANDEVAVLKERYSEALNKKGSFLNISHRKSKEVFTLGESWGRQQLKKAKSAIEKLQSKLIK